MAAGWLKALDAPMNRGRVKITGLIDTNTSAAEALRDAFALSDAEISDNLATFLDAHDVDLVFDVAIPAARRAIVETALGHGCDVLTEKPMAASLEDARAINAATERAGRIHAVVQNRRFNAGVRRIRAMVESGALGQITGLHCDFFIGAHFGGFRDEMEHVLLLDMAIHTFDAARFMLGADPLAVYCLETNPAGSWYAHDAAANAIFEFSDDIVATYRGSWCAEGANTSWESAWRIIGTKGTLLWDGEDGLSANVVAGDEGFFRPLAAVDVPPVPDEAQTHGHASMIAHFLDAVEARTAPETVGTDNIRSLEMVFAAIESARTRQRVLIARQEH
ncbi:oxidoreductase [Martelella endophytica]|uniref:Oxidoreductase n=2 Tax=Martelella endophytica TaxID=1486262 RepID=A0A0D5LLJ8_MAREN|nr:oxidoreductase [Martelella endophytica]